MNYTSDKSKTNSKENQVVSNIDDMVLADGIITTFDSKQTGLNNNTIILGATGTGKSVSIAEAQILKTQNNSLIVPVSKKKISDDYYSLMKSRGYSVLVLDYTNSSNSNVSYNPLRYVVTEDDIFDLATNIVYSEKNEKNATRDPYWDNAAVSFIAAEIAAIYENWAYAQEEAGDEYLERPTIIDLIDFHRTLKFSESFKEEKTISNVDAIFEELERKNPYSFAASNWASVKGLAQKTLSCIISTVNVAYSHLFTPIVLENAVKHQQLEIDILGEHKSVLFIITSPVDKVSQKMVNILYSQIFKNLYALAEEKDDYRLDVPVHIVADDFACGCPIPDFARYISVFRSVGISSTILLQSESQLATIYGKNDAQTIVDNCDRTVFFGSNDLNTCTTIAKKANLPLEDVLELPLGNVIVMQRGQKAKIAKRYNTYADKNFILAKAIRKKR